MHKLREKANASYPEKTGSSSKLDMTNIIYIQLFYFVTITYIYTQTFIHTYLQTAYEHSSNVKDDVISNKKSIMHYEPNDVVLLKLSFLSVLQALLFFFAFVVKSMLKRSMDFFFVGVCLSSKTTKDAKTKVLDTLNQMS